MQAWQSDGFLGLQSGQLGGRMPDLGHRLCLVDNRLLLRDKIGDYSINNEAVHCVVCACNSVDFREFGERVGVEMF